MKNPAAVRVPSQENQLRPGFPGILIGQARVKPVCQEQDQKGTDVAAPMEPGALERTAEQENHDNVLSILWSNSNRLWKINLGF